MTPDEGLFDAIVEDEYGDTGPDQGHQILASTSTTCSSVVLRSESLAREKLRSKAFSFCDLFEVMSSLPLKPTKRHRCISGDPNVKIEHFLAGLYTHGSFTGVTRNTSAFPWVVKYVSAFGRTQVDESWSSRILSKNVKSSIHSDSRNLADTKVITMTFGAFTGGELWIEDGEGDNNSHPTYKEDATKVRKGKLISTKEPPYGSTPSGNTALRNGKARDGHSLSLLLGVFHLPHRPRGTNCATYGSLCEASVSTSATKTLPGHPDPRRAFARTRGRRRGGWHQ